MNYIMLASLSLMTMATPAMAAGQSGAGAERLFRCTLQHGRTVEVSAEGDRLHYRYGTPGHAELTLSGTAEAGNVRFFQQRYASMESQLRFVSGDHSYIVYEMGPNHFTGTYGVSGLLVMRGTRRIGDYGCRRFTEFSAGFDLMRSMPEDSEDYSAM